ncbi:MAG: peptidylprolyl isomerase [Proteobacteria bacterium]|nr:peptidylprolyl isomerase [Pseudomonadota bacterium]MDE3208446.1 peptidylprolyl isomerase [Pseudomonadota bacterium]
MKIPANLMLTYPDMETMPTQYSAPKAKYFFFAIFFLALSLLPTLSQAKPIDWIVAVVNNDVITSHELNTKLRSTENNLKQQGIPLPPTHVLKAQVLEHLITERIELQQAKKTGITVSDEQMDEAINNIAARNHLSRSELEQQVTNSGISLKDFEHQIRNEITIEKLKERDVLSRIQVSNTEINNFLKQKALQPDMLKQYKIAHIFIRLPDNATSAQIKVYREKASRALADLKSGKNFAQVAASYSDAPDALSGGQLNWRSGAQLPDLYLRAISSLKPGEMTGILRSPNGFNILKLVNERDEHKQVIVTQTHVRHILIRTSDLVSDKEARDKLEKIRAKILAGASFAKMAKAYSDDGSASQGGDLGWISPGETVPAFENAMNQLAPGQISQPVHTQFGWHLIQVLGRRQANITKKEQRNEARKAIYESKADEAVQEWLRELRGAAYVRYFPRPS